MIRIFLNDISGNVIGYEYIFEGAEVYKNDILIDETAENVQMLKKAMEYHDVYYRDGSLIEGEKDEYFAEREKQAAKIRELTKAVEGEHHSFIDDMISGMSIEKAIEQTKKNRDLLEEAKREYKETLENHEQEIFDLHAQAHRQAEEGKEWRYYSSVCLLIRDENRYLEEWITHHLGIGADHIYIYDNGVKENVNDIVSGLENEAQDKITVIQWQGEFENVQQDAYNDFLEKYGSETRWVNFIDSDEFIRLGEGFANINEALKELEDYTTVYGSFIEYNANGKESYEAAPVRERFTQTTDVSKGIYHKDFIQPARIDRMDRHYPKFSAHGNYTKREAESFFIVEHYYTKSWEEWLEKIERGSSDPKYLKHKNEFFIYNPDMKYLMEEDQIQEYKA